MILREAFRSLSAERHERKVDGGGETRRRWKILSSKPMEQREREREWERERLGNKGEKRKMEDEGGRGSWRTNRRSLTDVATPYVTFIADALLRHLLISSRTL